MSSNMRATVVLAHPERRSFNGRLADISSSSLEAAGWAVSLSDLYSKGFEPSEGPRHFRDRSDETRFHAQTEQRSAAERGTTAADVVAEQENVLAAELLVVHFPLWWFGMPAILKGWIDRVFAYGAMYTSTMRYDSGICRGKRMIACITTGASADSCAFDGRESDTRLLAWPLLFPFRYLGFDVLAPVILHGIGGVAAMELHDDGLTDLDRHAQRWRDTIENLDERPVLPYNADDDFGDDKRLRPGAPVHSPFISHQRQPLWD